MRILFMNNEYRRIDLDAINFSDTSLSFDEAIKTTSKFNLLVNVKIDKLKFEQALKEIGRIDSQDLEEHL